MAIDYSRLTKKEQEWARYYEECDKRLEEGLTTEDIDAPEEDMRAVRLAQYLGITEDEIEQNEYNQNIYNVDGGEQEWFVGTWEDAREEALTAVEEFCDEVGLEGLSNWMQRWVLNYAVDTDRLWNWCYDDIVDYVDEMSDDDVVYEIVERRIYDKSEVYEVDEEESLEQRKVVYTDKILDSVDVGKLRDTLIDEFYDNIEDPYDYLSEVWGEDYVNNSISDGGLIEWDDVYNKMLDEDGFGTWIASYNGKEVYLDKDENNNDLFGYRIN